MTVQFQPPPTWAPVTVADARTGEQVFNPVWLKWFLDVVGVINSSGGGSGSIQHNGLGGLQGGTTNEFYHLTNAEHATIIASRSCFMVYQSVAQAIGAAAWTAVTFGTKVFDTQTEVSAAGVFTAGQTGYYSFTAGFTGSQVVSVCNRQLALYVNGAERARLQGSAADNGVPIIAGGVSPVHLTAADTVDIRYFSANADTGTTGQNATYFGGFRLQ